MSRNWLIGVGVGLLATAALVTVGVAAYELGERETEHVIVSGSETAAGRLIVEHDGWRHGGPGFLILPLLILGAVFLLSSRRRHGWCGPGYRGGPWGPGRWDAADERYRDERDPERRSRSEPYDRERGPERPVDAPPPPTAPESGS